MKLRRLAYGFSSILLSVSSVFVLVSPVAHAATCSWTGANSNNFNDSGNWSGCSGVLPGASDIINFDYANVTGTVTLNNDITSFSVAGITFTGTGTVTTQKNVIINGNDIIVSGDISSDNMLYFPQINTNLVLGADIALSGSMQISEASVTDKTINLNGHNITVQNNTNDLRINSTITGAGNININSLSSASLSRANTFTGTVQVAGSAYVSNVQGFGNVANVVTVSGAAGQVNTCATGTISNPIVFNSANAYGALLATAVCSWSTSTGPNAAADITLAGAITLGQNTVVAGEGKVTITGDITGAFTLTMLDGQAGSLVLNSTNNASTSSNGTYASTHKVTTVTNTAGTSFAISYNQEVVVNSGAVAGDIYMYSGKLKGTGTVGNINLSGGTVAPGMSPGVLASGNVTFGGGSFEEEIGGTTSGQYDQLNVTGTVNLGSTTTLTVTHWNGYRPALNDSFVIINNDGADAVSGTFQGLAQGATVTVDGVVYTISYTGGTGNDVVLTATDVSAATSPVSPTAPNTGFEMLSNNPLLTLVVTLIAVAGISYAARKQLLQNKK